MQALVLDAPGRTANIQRLQLPTPQANEVLIKVHSIALNPVDSLYVANPLGSSGRVIGSDFAGAVVSAAPDAHLQVGRRVAGFLQGACSVNERPGAFAEYVLCESDLLWRPPNAMSSEEAAGVSLCALTAAQAVWYRLGLPAPFEWQSTSASSGQAASPPEESLPKVFFIYGASTSVGMFAVQLVRRSAQVAGIPIKIIGAASKARWPMLCNEPYTYDHLVDYRDTDWPSQVLGFTHGVGVKWAFDCISEGSTVRNVCRTLQAGGKVAIVRSREGGAWDEEGIPAAINPVYGAVWEGLGVEVQYQNLAVPASKEARSFAVEFYNWLSTTAAITPNPVRLMPGGIHRVVPDGLALLGTGSMGDRAQDRTEGWMRAVAGEKLVYVIAP